MAWSLLLPGSLRLVPYALLALAPVTAISCVAEDDTIDLGSVSDGKSDRPQND